MKHLGAIMTTLPTTNEIPANRQPTCLTCDDTGWVYPPGCKGVARCESCFERKRGHATGVPKDLQDFQLDSYEAGDLRKTAANQDAIQQCRYFIEAVHPCVYLFGSVGTGKTALAAATLNTLHRAGKHCRFWRVSDLMSKLIGEDSAVVLDTVKVVPFLVIDDIGGQKPNDWQRQIMLQIFDGRNDNGLQTIWTSNLTLEELAEFMGDDERLASRIAGQSKVVELEGSDYRLRQAKRRAVAKSKSKSSKPPNRFN